MSADIKKADLGPLGEKIANLNGESRQVCPVPSRPGWLYKEYLGPLPAAEADRLKRLVELTAEMTSVQRDIVGRHVSWPYRRVVSEEGQVVGVLLPAAPDAYQHTWTLSGGRTKRRPLEVDVLALPESEQARRGLPTQSLQPRFKVCASMAAVGSLFESKGIVYLDWSYSNVFWSPQEQSAYVIDMDGCSFGPRPQIHQPGWDDPLVPSGLAGNESDRYRLALLVARCLTGERADAKSTRVKLNSLRVQTPAEEAIDLILNALTASTTSARPSVERISAALNVAAGLAAPQTSDLGGVVGWRQIQPKNPTATGPKPTATATTSTRATRTATTGSYATTSASSTANTGTTPSRATSYGSQPPTPRISSQPVKKPSSDKGLVILGLLLLILPIILIAIIILIAASA